MNQDVTLLKLLCVLSYRAMNCCGSMFLNWRISKSPFHFLRLQSLLV